MLNLGIIGIGSNWENAYLPALKRLEDRVNVRAVFDPIAERSQSIADDIDARIAFGILELAERTDVSAILLLDGSWFGSVAAKLLLTTEKPIYFSSPLNESLADLKSLYDLARLQAVFVMPELGHRYTPATGRLQELMATELGRPTEIQVFFARAELGCGGQGFDTTEELIAWSDWCAYIFRRRAQTVSSRVHSACTVICIEFGDGQTAKFFLWTTAPKSEPATTVITICEDGTATINGESTITWCIQKSLRSASLSSERTKHQVMLDHFCRRAIGGLIPVPDMNEVCCGIATIDAAQKSLDGDWKLKIPVER